MFRTIMEQLETDPVPLGASHIPSHIPPRRCGGLSFKRPCASRRDTPHTTRTSARARRAPQPRHVHWPHIPRAEWGARSRTGRFFFCLGSISSSCRRSNANMLQAHDCRVSTQKCLLSQEWSPLSSVDERDHDAPYGAIATAPPLPPQASTPQAWKSNSHLSAHYRVLLFNQSKIHAQKQLHLEQHRDSLCHHADASHLSPWMTAKQ